MKKGIDFPNGMQSEVEGMSRTTRTENRSKYENMSSLIYRLYIGVEILRLLTLLSLISVALMRSHVSSAVMTLTGSLDWNRVYNKILFSIIGEAQGSKQKPDCSHQEKYVTS